MDQTIFDPIDAYCERLGPGLWAEPLNAVTNLAFIVAAVICLHGVSGIPRPPLGLALVIILAAIGVGSGLFHTFANGLDGASRCAGHRGFRLRLRLRREPPCAGLVARLCLGLDAGARPLPRAGDRGLRGCAGLRGFHPPTGPSGH
jgi:hypothetical protein